MVCTDVAARGLDFPNVDLIIQCDIPEQPANYFHRAGRTARAGREGVSLLMLTPLEVKIALRMFKMLLKTAKTGGKAVLELNEDGLIQEYKLTASEKQLASIQNQIFNIVQNDEYLYNAGPMIVRTYARVFEMFGGRMGFGKNQFDYKGVQNSLGMRAKSGRK